MQAYIAASREKPVAYRPSFARIARSVGAGVWLSQLCYWDGKESNDDGWIFKTVPEFETETGMSEREQETARRRWSELGVVEISKRGLPAMPCYRIAWARLMELSISAPARSESASQVRTICPNLSGRSQGGLVRTDRPNIHTESTSRDYKTEREGAARRARPTIDAPPAIKAQPAPGKRGIPLPGEIVQPDPAVAMYVALTQYEPTKLQADDIKRAVVDLTLWEQVIRDRDGFGCSHRNVKAALDDYRAGGVRDYRAERATNGKAAAPGDTIEESVLRAAQLAGFDMAALTGGRNGN
jgi:hypothetical protein